MAIGPQLAGVTRGPPQPLSFLTIIAGSRCPVPRISADLPLSERHFAASPDHRFSFRCERRGGLVFFAAHILLDFRAPPGLPVPFVEAGPDCAVSTVDGGQQSEANREIPAGVGVTRAQPQHLLINGQRTQGMYPSELLSSATNASIKCQSARLYNARI